MNSHLHSKIYTIFIAVVVDFCKLAIDFLQNGPNLKLYQNAAKKLSAEVDTVQNCIYGLVNLLLLSCKHKVIMELFANFSLKNSFLLHEKLSEADFRDSVLTIGFSQEQQSVLSKFYESRLKDISELLNKLCINDPHYHNLEWRFEILVV